MNTFTEFMSVEIINYGKMLLSKDFALLWLGHAVAQLVEALRCKRVRSPMVSLEFFILSKPSGRTVALGLTQPLTEMSTRNIS
jgi:hypothetical protein